MPSDHDFEAVKAILSSPTACTSATIEALSRLLEGRPAKKTKATRPDPAGQDGGISQGKTMAKPSNRVAAMPATRTKASPTTTCELSLQEKIKLATEVVNICLKTLNQAVLSSGGARQTESTKNSSAVTEPLSSRSLNVPNKPAKLAKNNDANGKENGIDGVAQCARIALASLRRYGDQGKTRALPHLQVESAMSALIAKLIALELVDPACKEIRILARRLAMGASSGQREVMVVTDSSVNLAAPASPLAELLHLEQLPDSPAKLSLVFTTQIHILRSLRYTKIIPDPFDLHRLLNPASQSSPCTLLEAMVSVDGKEKCIRLLGGLAHAISLVSDRVSSKLDSAFDLKLDAARGVLQLRILSIEILCKSWSLAGHTVDISNQLCQPFKRHVESYLCYSKASAEHQFEAVDAAYKEFSNTTRKLTLSEQQRQELESACLDIDQILYRCSLATKNRQRSQELASAITSRLSVAKFSGLYKASQLCRLAIVTVPKWASIPKAEVCQILRKALKSYSAAVEGSSQDLDDLLASISSLRKAAMAILKESLLKQNVQKLDPDLLGLLKDSVLKIPAFVLSYLGKPIKQQDTGTADARYEKRKFLASKVGRAIIESVVALARLDTQAPSNEWRSYQHSLETCLTLQKQLVIDDADSPKKQTSVSVLISNAYWSRYLALRQSSSGTVEIISILELTVRLLEDLPMEQQELGLFPYKLERLAYSQEQNKNWERASETYKQTLQYLYLSGLVELAAEKLLWIPRLTSLLEDDKLKLVGKAIDGFCRTTIRLDDHDEPLLCSTETQPALQGFIAELQLVSLRKYYGENGDSTQIARIEQLGQTLQTVYTNDRFPIRRLRTLTSLAQCGVLLDTEKQLLEISEILEDDERSLLPFHDHLIARQNAVLGMKYMTDSKLLSSALQQWAKLASGRAVNDQKSLQKQIDDLEEWTSLLNSIVDYADAHGLIEQRTNALDLLVFTNRISSVSSADALVFRSSSLATELAELGFREEAQTMLSLGKSYLSDVTDLQFSTYHWQTAQATFDISIGNYDGSKNMLSLMRVYLDSIAEHGSRLRSVEAIRSEAQYHSICARHCFGKGEYKRSTYHIKQSVRLLLQGWTITERRYGKQATTTKDSQEEQGDSNLEALTDPENSTFIGGSGSPNIESRSSKFWGLVRPLFETLMLAARISSHAGLLCESRYYVLEAIRIAESVAATPLRVRALLAHSMIESAAGDQAAGRDLHKKASDLLEACRCLGSDQAVLLITESAICLSFCSDDDAQNYLEEAYKLADNLQTPHLLSLQPRNSGMTEIEDRLAGLEITASKGPKSRNNVPRSYKTNKELHQGSTTNSSTNTCPSNISSFHVQLKSRLLLRKAQVLSDKRQFSEAATVQKRIVQLAEKSQGDLQQALIATKLHLEQGLALLGLDPVLNIIPEATLSYPSATSSAPPPAKTAKSSRTVRKDPLSSGRQKQQVAKPEHYIHLSQALEDILATQSLPSGRSSALEGHQIADLRLKGHLALNAVIPTLEKTEKTAENLVNHLEHGRNHAYFLGYAAIQADKLLRSDMPKQPLVDPAEDLDLDTQQFQSDYIDIIPSSWNIVSISLSEDRSELRIGSFKSRGVPLVLSVPLNRQAKDGTDLDFCFDHAKSELQRIINLANFSTHEGAALAKKGAKAEWWEARAALDSKLGDLLINIENIWLGGFKGALKHCTVHAELAVNFELAFVKTLDSHLSSRKANKHGKTDLVKLDMRILELFIRLGHPSELNNIDESILDLLYFVIDILWFNGEHNVCDEIDFDPMVADIRNALTIYHRAARVEVVESATGHTILILDKRLHSFPWESLPCMEGQSVCRLPSLYFLRQRILQMQETGGADVQSLSIDAGNGAYILNPSGDLNSTLSTFKSPLSSLTTWSSHINSVPSESDIANALSTKSLYLYFGHGGGGQYIRSRTVRRLDNCAVTLLMGCSSASLTEAGEYESYGTPLNYLYAGAPAVLGTLWDVTDKDIDRLSLKMLQDWGLLEGVDNVDLSTSPIKRNASDKGNQKGKKKKKATVNEMRSTISLDEAVARSRSACLMRYLNGAAVVVYGIPVSLQ